MSIFRVTRRTLVTRYEDEVILETDDPLEVEATILDEGGTGHLIIEGTHPTHDWVAPTPAGWAICVKCDALDSGSLTSLLPCEGKMP